MRLLLLPGLFAACLLSRGMVLPLCDLRGYRVRRPVQMLENFTVPIGFRGPGMKRALPTPSLNKWRR